MKHFCCTLFEKHAIYLNTKKRQEVAMNRLDYGCALDSVVEKPSRSRNSNKKRKWREIEALKEKHRLLKELQDIDNNFNDEIDNLLV